MARRYWVVVALLASVLHSSISLLFTGGFARVARPQKTQRHALDAEGLASFASFSVLAGMDWQEGGNRLWFQFWILSSWKYLNTVATVRSSYSSRKMAQVFFVFSPGSPIPLGLGGLLRLQAELDELDEPPKSEGSKSWFGFPRPSTPAPTADVPEPRDLMWAFPSFAVFLETVDETAPLSFPLWARWLCLLTFWPGVIWYLYYKLLVEDDLREYRGLGIGGSLVIIPFAIGLFAGVFGEFAYGALEGGFFDNAFSTAFYSAFAWIYLNQWFLYQKVNQLMEDAGRPAPLDPFGLFIPGWNLVTGIRQIHFLAEYWAIQRGETLPQDAFADLFPFAKKPTLSFSELATTPGLWFNWSVIFGKWAAISQIFPADFSKTVQLLIAAISWLLMIAYLKHWSAGKRLCKEHGFTWKGWGKHLKGACFNAILLPR